MIATSLVLFAVWCGSDPALTNPPEYFAELSESWFGTNDFYPFVRAEVTQFDPEMAELLRKLWAAP